MNILCVGDVVGSAGCRHLERVLPMIKRRYEVDVCIVNGENSADGNGILPSSTEALFRFGADVITTGNHVFRRREIYDVLDRRDGVLRPANFPNSAPGCGVFVVDKGRYQVAVINLMGQVYMDTLACPFEALDAVLANQLFGKYKKFIPYYKVLVLADLEVDETLNYPTAEELRRRVEEMMKK